MADWDDMQEVEEITDSIRPILADRDPTIQGAVIADLLAIWLAGHPDFVREVLLAEHINAVRKLVQVNEKIMFGDAGHPSNTD